MKYVAGQHTYRMTRECKMNDRRKVSSVFDTMTADRINRKIYTNLKKQQFIFNVLCRLHDVSTEDTSININTVTQEAKNQYLE